MAVSGQVSEQAERKYYAGRAAAERELERLAKDEAVAAIYRQLALGYERLALDHNEPPSHTA